MQFPPFHWRPLRPIRPRPVHLPDGVRMIARAGRAHVLARALYRVLRIDFDMLPRREQWGYVNVQLAAWQPFPSTAQAVVPDASGVLAFAWDAEAFAARCAAAGLDATKAKVVPETLLHPPLATDGTRLLACLAGWEGQVWRAGVLVASRWWPQRPDQAQWQLFLRGAGLAAAPLPDALQPDRVQLLETLATRPAWARPRDAGLQARSGRVVSVAAALALWLMLLASVALTRQWLAAQQAMQALTQRQTTLATETVPIAAARAEALANLAQIQRLIDTIERPQGLALLAHLADRLPTQLATIRELEWSAAQWPAELRLALELPAGTPRVTFVQALEAGGWLTEVREEAPEAGMEQGLLILKAQATGQPPDTAQPSRGEP